MSLPGRALKSKLAELTRKHNARPVQRDPLPLLPLTVGPQIIEGFAATPDIDADRMSFSRGSLSWPDDVSRIPLLLGHSDKVAGKILSLDYDVDGKLHIRALVEDVEASRLPGLSVCATIIESSVHAEDSSCFYFTIEKATLDHIGLTAIPANAAAIVASRRDVLASDTTLDSVAASVFRMRKLLDDFGATVKAAPSPPPAPSLPTPNPRAMIGAAAPRIYGKLPAAMLSRKRTPFRELIAALPAGDPG